MSEVGDLIHLQTPLAPTKPRPYVCVKCGRRVKIPLTDTAYRAPIMKYAPHNCTCGSPMVRASKHHKPNRRRRG
jgi:DNA-directed RNA polymerase subunit RPC12/RpoP